jgi:murein DD-endopeptidase MepM/ murein hydrolase activator NlpD
VHQGQDVFAKAGTPLVAIRDGRIVEKGDDGGRGNYVAIWSPEAQRTFVYLHMLRPSRVGQGDTVDRGERVGAVGCTGSCWGDHLHLEIRRGRGTTGRPLDPLPLLRRLAARRDGRE